MKAHYLLLPLALGVFALESLQGQAPVILQAATASATPATAHAPAAAAAANDAAATKNIIQLLQSMQATNTNTIKNRKRLWRPATACRKPLKKSKSSASAGRTLEVRRDA